MIALKKTFVLFGFFWISQLGFGQSSEAGVIAIDAREWSPNDSPFPIAGMCHFFKGKLLTPEQCKNTAAEVVNFPELWKAADGSNTQEGVGTYSLTVLLPTSHETDFGLALPQMYSCYTLWANGKLIAENGKVGISEAESRPQWLPQTVYLHDVADSLTLVLQVANFHHSKGGLKEPIYLGSTSQMKLKHVLAIASNLAESLTLFLTGAFFLYFFFRRSKKPVALYFALLCLTWSLRSLFSNLYLPIAVFPDFDWTALVRIEYITLYLTMIWAILFVSQLFNYESNIFAKYAFVFGNILFALFTLFSSPKVFTL
jgi:hypothetical protein